MLPPPLVLTNENCGVLRVVFPLLAALCFGLSGCSPPGPRALLNGKELVEEGRHAEAVERLEQATTLLPTNALAWNYLGLAYHGSGQPEAAVKAYRAALALDHKLITVRYNLGCLFLEENNLAAATDELKSYTLLRPGDVEGWLKLGTAQLGARRLDEAEKSFRTANELQARNPEALNGLGLVQVQRRRWLDANGYFNVAARQEPPHPPAVLNSAVLNHQYLNNRPMALELYRRYLGLTPKPADWESVEATVRQLQLELNPPAVAQAPAPRPTVPVSQVAQTAPRADQNAAPPAPTVRPQPVAPPSVQPSPPKATVTPVAPPVRTSVVSAPTSVSQPATVTRPAAESTRPLSRVVVPERVEPPPTRPVEIEVARVPSDVVVKPAQDLTRSPAESASRPSADDASSVAAKDPGDSAKRSLLSRLNPFGGRTKSDPASTAGDSSSPSAPASDAARLAFPRYNYLSPAAPTPGSRAEGEKAFRRGIEAYRDNNRTQAIREYRRAVESDPAYFDAYYNLGLSALETGETRLSLWAYEIALALKPDSVEARYNFALALKSGGYAQDAVEQLLKILSAHPEDARAHLSTANLFAQQLRQPGLAREHYQRVLEINPRHPEAAKIRFWLAANSQR